MVRPGVTYPGALPWQVARWYVYVEGMGHCVMVVPAHVYHPEHEQSGYLVPVPVATALREGVYLTPTGHALMEVDYEPGAGVMIDPRDREYAE